jgi:membrane fusion protein (multidrug efflux system)
MAAPAPASSSSSPSSPPAGASPAGPPPHVVEERRKGGLKKIAIVGVVGAVVVGGYFASLAMHAADQQTDNAIVDADVVPVAVRTSGLVAHVRVVDNQAVKKGDVLVELDTAELQAKLRQAEAELAAAQAQDATADAQRAVAEAGARGGLSTAKAQVTSAQAALSSQAAQLEAAAAQLSHAEVQAKKAQSDLERATKLRASGALTQEALDNAFAADDGAKTALAAARAQVHVAEEARHLAESRVQEAGGVLDANTPLDAKIAAARGAAAVAKARVQTAQAAVDLARVVLSYGTVTAPADGTVSRLTVREGQLVSAGQTLASLVPHTTYVVANYKETQVAAMKPGQRVDIEVDALPGEHFEGVVDSLAGATGSRFSLLPPDNASGNFVKVVQRVPVRIRWTKAPEGVLAGMSAVVTVHTG